MADPSQDSASPADSTPAADPADITELSFEAAMKELEAIVGTLEQGEVALDQAIGNYERGVALKRHCEAKLAEAEAKVERIRTDESGQAIGAEPLDGPEASG